MCEIGMGYMPPLCECGCGEFVVWNKKKKCWNTYIKNHCHRGGDYSNRVNAKQPYCQCKCGNLVTWNKSKRSWNVYINGHQFLVQSTKEKARIGFSEALKTNPTIRENISVAQKKRYENPDERKKTGLASKKVYKDNPNQHIINSMAVKKAYQDRPELYEKNSLSKKKVYQDRPELKEQSSENLVRLWQTPEFRNKTTKAIQNSYVNNPARKERQSISQKKRFADNPELREQRSLAMKSVYTSRPELIEAKRQQCYKRFEDQAERDNLSRIFKQYWNEPEFRAKMEAIRSDPEYIANWIAGWNRSPNKPESLLIGLFPDSVRYTGGGTFHVYIELHLPDGTIIKKRKIPDFKVTGQKKVIEFNGNYPHRNDPPDYVLIDALNRAGFELLIIWEDELKDIPAMLQRVSDFIGEDRWQMSLAI